MKQEPIDYYKILGINQTSSIHEIKRSFRQKAKRLHPDLVAGSNKSDTAMKLLLKAYQVLSDPRKRKEYDHYRKTIAASSRFNYRDFLRKREDDFYSQSHLVFYDLLHDREHDALSLFEKLVYTYNIPIEHYLGREDFMDCAFLLAEEYEKNKEYEKAYDLLIQIVLLEYEKPYFKHFMEEVIERLKNMACTKMQEVLEPEIHIEYLTTLVKYNFSPKITAHLLKKISELYVEMGKIEEARYYLTKSLHLAPGLSGIKKLKKKTAIASS